MQNNNFLIISTSDIDAIEELHSWLCGEFVVSEICSSNDSLGLDLSKIKVLIDKSKQMIEKFIEFLKNWITNYNKDIELTFENGEKKAIVKCPAKRVNDQELLQVFSSLEHFFD